MFKDYIEELISFFSTQEIKEKVEDEKKEEKKENRERLQQYISPIRRVSLYVTE